MTEYWVQVETGLPTSKLIDKARDQLGLDTDQAIGKFVRLWLAVMTLGNGGSLADRSNGWIEEAVGWRGSAGVFAEFVRREHVDETGRIRDWLDKYGRLEYTRDQARRIKRDQRTAEQQRTAAMLASAEGLSTGQSGGRPPDKGVDRGVDRGVDNQVDRSEDNKVDSSYISSISSSGSSLAFQEQTPISPGETVAPAAKPAGDWVGQFARAWPFGRWAGIVEGYLRASRSPIAAKAEIELHLTGEMHYPKTDPELVGYALNQYVAAEGANGRFKPNYFAGFVRRARGQRATVRETEHIARAETEKRERDAEEAEAGNFLQRFSEHWPERFAELQEQAEGDVDPKIKMGRGLLVQGRLAELVREEMARAS